MKFEDLTKKDISNIKKIYNNIDLSFDERIDSLKDYIGKSERTVRRWLVDLGLKNKQDVDSEQFKKAKEKIHNKKKKRFLVTWAQNNTQPHELFMDNLETYAKYIDAEIIVIAGRYSNMSQTLERDSVESWDKRFEKYLTANRHDIHKYLSVMADVKIQATAINPFVGMHGLSKENSCIFGSPKSQLEVVPILNGDKPKMMLTTGSATVQNYTDSKIGAISTFNHQIGAVVVEIQDSNIFHIRQITTSDGNFNDLCFNVTDEKITKIKEVEGIVLGDLHYGNHDEEAFESTFRMMNHLEPKHIILHDVLDFYSSSHHGQKDPFIQFALEKSGKNCIETELRNLMEGLSRFEKFKNVVIVRSNHDVHLDKFLQNDWRKLSSMKNSLIYMELAQILLRQHADGNVIGVIPELINRKFPKFTTLGYNDSYTIKNWEVAVHGDIGISGSRPNPNSFLKLNKKMITGHTHSPKKKDGLMVVGTLSKLRLSYNLGASAWLNSDIIIHKSDGKAQHVFFVGKKREFTTFF